MLWIESRRSHEAGAGVKEHPSRRIVFFCIKIYCMPRTESRESSSVRIVEIQHGRSSMVV